MNTLEVHATMVARYPGRKIKVWDWVDENGKNNLSIDVDNLTFRSSDFKVSTLKEMIEKIKVPSQLETLGQELQNAVARVDSIEQEILDLNAALAKEQAPQ